MLGSDVELALYDLRVALGDRELLAHAHMDDPADPVMERTFRDADREVDHLYCYIDTIKPPDLHYCPSCSGAGYRECAECRGDGLIPNGVGSSAAELASFWRFSQLRGLSD